MRGRQNGSDGWGYKKRSVTDVKKRRERDDKKPGFIKSFPEFKPAEGPNRIRILPPTWEDKSHWGYTIYLHYSVGPDNAVIICPKEMGFVDNDPICDERVLALHEDDSDYAYKLKPTKRILVWVIDRKNEDDGPKLWSMPQSIDNDIIDACLACAEGTNDVLAIDDPDEGYDITFTKGGKGLNTKYTGINISRRSTVLTNNAKLNSTWAAFIVKNTLPSTIVVLSNEKIGDLFGVNSVDSVPSHEDEGGMEEKSNSELQNLADEDARAPWESDITLNDLNDRDKFPDEESLLDYIEKWANGNVKEEEIDQIFDECGDMNFDELIPYMVKLLDINELEVKEELIRKSRRTRRGSTNNDANKVDELKSKWQK